jgi:hypothetical protein
MAGYYSIGPGVTAGLRNYQVEKERLADKSVADTRATEQYGLHKQMQEAQLQEQLWDRPGYDKWLYSHQEQDIPLIMQQHPFEADWQGKVDAHVAEQFQSDEAAKRQQGLVDYANKGKQDLYFNSTPERQAQGAGIYGIKPEDPNTITAAMTPQAVPVQAQLGVAPEVYGELAGGPTRPTTTTRPAWRPDTPEMAAQTLRAGELDMKKRAERIRYGGLVTSGQLPLAQAKAEWKYLYNEDQPDSFFQMGALPKAKLGATEEAIKLSGARRIELPKQTVLKAESQAETKRHDQALENISSQQVSVSRQNAATSRARVNAYIAKGGTGSALDPKTYGSLKQKAQKAVQDAYAYGTDPKKNPSIGIALDDLATLDERYFLTPADIDVLAQGISGSVGSRASVIAPIVRDKLRKAGVTDPATNKRLTVRYMTLYYKGSKRK